MNKEARGLTRTQLYEAVWTEPIYRLAPRCGVTDVGMAKLCRRYRIPVPGRGYWRRLETRGMVPKRPPLPRFPDLEADAVIARLGDQEAPIEPSKPLVAPAIDATALHPVAASAWERLKSTRPNREDVLDAGYLGLKVMPDTVERAVLIVDALTKEFGTRGCEIENDEKGIGVVSRGPERVPFELTQDPVTGRLILRRLDFVIGRKTWADGARTKLERILGGFVVGADAALVKLRETREEREHLEASQKCIADRGAERRKTAERERRIEKRVTRAAIAWERAGRLRAFAAAIDAALKRGDQLDAATAAMSAEAREIAARLDPLDLNEPPRPDTMDYVSFRDWYARLLAVMDKEEGYKRYGAKAAYEARMTPEEASAEVDWAAYWY